MALPVFRNTLVAINSAFRLSTNSTSPHVKRVRGGNAGELLTRLKERLATAEPFEAGSIEAVMKQFLDDEGIRELNRAYLGKDSITDVLAFSLGDEGVVLGDVYVGVPQARRQAQEYGVPVAEELLRLAIHGTLHVLGHKHPEGEDRQESEMFRTQEELLSRVLGRLPGGGNAS